MKVFKKVLLAAAACTALASAQASPITVGGVTWDPDFSASLADNDFTARYDFIQWYTTPGNAVGGGLNAAPNPVNAVDPGTLGNILQGVGKISALNGTSTFANGGELTFVFGGFIAATGPSLTGGWLKIYKDTTPDFNLLSGTGAEDGTLWLSLTSDSNTFAGSAFNAGSLTSFFSAIGGDAFGNFKDANIGLFFGSDAESTAYAQFNNTRYATAGGTIFSNSIPEPESLALVGLGLLAAGIARRKSISK